MLATKLRAAKDKIKNMTSYFWKVSMIKITI